MARARHEEVAWGLPCQPESRWPANLAVIAAVLLYVTLPERLTFGPTWLLPLLEAAVIVPLSIDAPKRHAREELWHRAAAIALIALVNAANVVSLVLLIRGLLQGTRNEASELIFGAGQIWLTNVIVFGLWYWELDRGGPAARCRVDHREPDFLFPQMTSPGVAPPDWFPRFLDYLYVAFTNATAFSPTDTLPLTRWAKVLMAIQSMASLLTVALVAARAVNILQ
jgi:uncharacterized membrane protein